MKKMENSFAVTGFVGKDASIHQFISPRDWQENSHFIMNMAVDVPA